MVVKCPRCGRSFDITYARAFSCKSCDVLLLQRSCRYVKCPFCGFEFTV